MSADGTTTTLLDRVPWAVTDEKVREAVERIATTCVPHAVVVFGSHVRGEASRDSDCDLLVVADDSTTSCRSESVRLRRALRGISMPVDIIVVRHGDLGRLKSMPGLIYGQILREGVVAYGHL